MFSSGQAGETIAFEILGASLICFFVLLIIAIDHCIRTDPCYCIVMCGIGLASLNVNNGCSLESKASSRAVTGQHHMQTGQEN